MSPTLESYTGHDPERRRSDDTTGFGDSLF
jgi:hypothetical protein